MKILPDTTLRIAKGESVSLELDVETQLGAVRLLPRYGSAKVVPATANAFDFPAYPSPEQITVEWLEASDSSEADFTSCVEVVSRHYFSIEELRKYGDGQDDFEDTEKYTDLRLWEVRQAAEEAFEEAAHRCFVQRIGSFVDYGFDAFLTLPHCDVTSLITTGYTLVSDCQIVRNLGTSATYPAIVQYVYGRGAVPYKVASAVLMLAAYYLRPSNTADRATGESSEAGYIHFTLAGINGAATSLPEVNATADEFGRKGAMVW